MQTVILAGGLGTRLSEETEQRPKPMVEIGGKPILWHIMSIYAHAGFHEFVIALGYKHEVVKEYFRDFYAHNNDLTVDLATGEYTVRRRALENWKVHLVDTGLHTLTAGRLLRLREVLDGGAFMCTYGDGLASIDIGELVAFHQREGRIATMTAVRPPARFGAVEIEGSRITEFREKPQASEGWINGGFFVFEPAIFDWIEGDVMLEHAPFAELARAGQLSCYRHPGFFQPMDTLRDKRNLEEMWASGNAPWAAGATSLSRSN